MPDENDVYDPETGEWSRISPESQWVTVDPEPDPDPEPTTVTSCNEIGKRHKYKNRETGEISTTCLVCHQPRAIPTQTRKTTASAPRSSGRSQNSLDMLLSAAWMGAGLAVRHGVPRPAGPAAGKVMQLEASIAGPKLHKALKKTALYPYLSIASEQFSWMSDLMMLIIPPVFVGLVAARPKMAKSLKPVLVSTLVPVLAEVAKKQASQAALLANLEGYNEETIAAASSIVDSLLDPDDDDEEENDS